MLLYNHSYGKAKHILVVVTIGCFAQREKGFFISDVKSKIAYFQSCAYHKIQVMTSDVTFGEVYFIVGEFY